MGLRPNVLGVLAEVGAEVERAMAQHGPMASPHEGYAVILEELDELKDEIWTNQGRTDAAWKEATQVAAMAVRYLLDLRSENPDSDDLRQISRDSQNPITDEGERT